MKRHTIPALLMIAVFMLSWAYVIIDDLIRVFHKDVTLIDMGVIFGLGFICGVALDLVPKSVFVKEGFLER